jgi:hypothetical protein
MDVSKIVEADPAVAERAFREYRAAWLAERNRIDGELMRGYKALSEGKTLISLTEAIQKGGVDSLGRPNLAIARADEAQVAMEIDRDGSLVYRPTLRTFTEDRRFRFPPDTLPRPHVPEEEDWWRQPWRGDWWARLPFIPPQYRPPLRLENYHLLWEAEWRRGTGPQRRDPMLLRRIGGDLFAVVAAWDLTPLEKLVLAR